MTTKLTTFIVIKQYMYTYTVFGSIMSRWRLLWWVSARQVVRFGAVKLQLKSDCVYCVKPLLVWDRCLLWLQILLEIHSNYPFSMLTSLSVDSLVGPLLYFVKTLTTSSIYEGCVLDIPAYACFYNNTQSYTISKLLLY